MTEEQGKYGSWGQENKRDGVTGC